MDSNHKIVWKDSGVNGSLPLSFILIYITSRVCLKIIILIVRVEILFNDSTALVVQNTDTKIFSIVFNCGKR